MMQFPAAPYTVGWASVPTRRCAADAAGSDLGGHPIPLCSKISENNFKERLWRSIP
jgi:hypothetical protein